MIQFVLVALVFLVAILVGFVIGFFSRPPEKVIYNEAKEELILDRNPRAAAVIPESQFIIKDPDVIELTDNIDSIQAGIVYRPTAEEIDKMHEPIRTKEAKEAIAEIIREEVPPEI